MSNLKSNRSNGHPPPLPAEVVTFLQVAAAIIARVLNQSTSPRATREEQEAPRAELSKAA